MEAYRRVGFHFFFLWSLAGHTGCMFVYFHNYIIYDRAYDLCRRNDMRLLRVDSDEKLQAVAKYAAGLKNFTMSTGSLTLSLRYDVTSSRYLWPGGTENTLTTNWDDKEPRRPGTLQCVLQKKNGKWRTGDCLGGTAFICETGYALDPVIETGTFPYYPEFKTFRRLTSESVNPSGQLGHANTVYSGGCRPLRVRTAVQFSMNARELNYTHRFLMKGQLMTPFKEEENSLDIYRGFRVNLMEECSIWCIMEPVCKGITFTTNKGNQNNVCILLK